MNPTTYTSAPYAEPKLVKPVFLLALIGVGVSIYFEVSWYWYALMGFLVLASVSAVHWRAVVEPAQGIVREEAWLWSRKLVRERRLLIKDFEAIVFKCFGTDDEEWGVGIRHQSGRKIWIKYCGSAGGDRPPGRAAEAFAWQLSCDTGLEIEEYKRRGHA